MGKWDEFNKKVDAAELAKQMEEARKNNVEVPKGKYVGVIEKMEIKETKDGRPMFAVQFRITDGEMKKKCVFLNRVIAGTKNDFAMIAGVESWLEKLQCEFETKFNGSYDDFANLIMDVMEDIDGVYIEIEYDPKAFNTISILEVL